LKNIEYDIPIFESNDLADLDLYSEKMATAIKGQIDKFGNPLAFKGIKQNISELDLISNAQSGDIYGVIETNKNYIWNSKEWIIYSDIMELDNYYNKEEINKKIDNIQALPTGGAKGQVLTKQSETEGDATWEDIEANEVYIGNPAEAPETAKIIIEDEDLEESSTLGKSEVYVGAEEPTTGEKVWFRKGKNHFNGELKAGTFLNGVPNTKMSTTRIRNTEYIGVKNNTDYTISAKYSKTLQINVMIYDEDKKFIKEVGWNNVPYTFTTTDTTKYIMFALRESSNANITTKDITEIQLEQGSKATSYEAYIEPQIFVRNSNGAYEEFTKNNSKEISFTKNDANAIFYESVYATENEVQICGDIRYSYTSGTNLKAFTIDSKYLPIINNEDNKSRYPISTDKGANGYAEVNSSGEVYIHTNGVATAAIINIRYRYK
jgi:hypothetical protein